MDNRRPSGLEIIEFEEKWTPEEEPESDVTETPEETADEAAEVSEEAEARKGRSGTPRRVKRPAKQEKTQSKRTRKPTRRAKEQPEDTGKAAHRRRNRQENGERISRTEVGEDRETDQPTTKQLEALVKEEQEKRRYFWTVRSTISALITVAAVSVLIAVLLLPVLQIYGSSMNPTLVEGSYVISVKNSKKKTGEVIAFYYNNKILVKRVIAQAGQWVDIAEDGTVYVDNVRIEEPYLQEKAFGECDLELPYQVPESRIFVMGDNRSVSVDSRSTTIGCIAEEQLVGKIVFCIWPLNRFGKVN